MAIERVTTRILTSTYSPLGGKGLSGADKGSHYTEQGMQKLTAAVQENMPHFIKIMDSFKPLKGELGGILINAFGAGLIAPIFIAYNPIPKTDEKTKKYTALRQPVSAALAVLIQAGLISPLTMIYNREANNGTLSKSPYLDTSNLKGESYYLKEFKKYNFNQTTPEAFAKSKVNEEIIKIINSLDTEGTMHFGPKKMLQPADVGLLINKTLDNKISSKKVLLEVISQKNIEKKVARAQLLSDPKNIKLINEMCTELVEYKGKDYGALIDKWTKCGNSDVALLAEEFKGKVGAGAIKHRASSTAKKVGLYVKAYKESNAITKIEPELTKLLKEALTLDEEAFNKTLAQMHKKYRRTSNAKLILVFIDKLNQRTSFEDKKEYIKFGLEQLEALKNAQNDRKKIVEIYQRAFYKNQELSLKNLIKNYEAFKVKDKVSVEELIKRIGKINLFEKLVYKIKGEGVFEKSPFTKDMVSSWQKSVADKLKGYKQITNILIGLFVTLPITCHALNWVYPRFMDIFFPHLSKNNTSDAPEEKAKTKVKGGKA